MNGSPTWTAGRSSWDSSVSSREANARAGQAVAAGGAADVDDRVAGAFGAAAFDLVVADDAEAEGVDERVAVVGFVEIDFAADGRDADAVAVVRDAGDDAGEEAAVRARLGRIGLRWGRSGGSSCRTWAGRPW